MDEKWQVFAANMRQGMGNRILSAGQLTNRLIVQEAGEGYQLKFSAPA